METIGNNIYFESEEELADFCIAPFASVKKSPAGRGITAADTFPGDA